MKVYTVTQYDPDMGLGHVTDVMWVYSYSTLQNAKYAIEEDLWDMFCDDWKEAVESGHDIPTPPLFLKWEGWENERYWAWGYTGSLQFAITLTVVI